MAHFAVVPPMSNEMSRSAPRLRARLAQPVAPAAGPDSIVCTGFDRGRLEREGAAVGLRDEQLAAEAASGEALPNAPR